MSERKRRDTKRDTAEKQSEGRKGLPRPAYVLIALAAVAFLIYSMVSVISIQKQIRQLKSDLNDLNEQITVQEIKNADKQKQYDSTGSDFSALAEQIARDDLGYIKEGERVFVNVAGD